MDYCNLAEVLLSNLQRKDKNVIKFNIENEEARMWDLYFHAVAECNKQKSIKDNYFPILQKK